MRSTLGKHPPEVRIISQEHARVGNLGERAAKASTKTRRKMVKKTDRAAALIPPGLRGLVVPSNGEAGC